MNRSYTPPRLTRVDCSSVGCSDQATTIVAYPGRVRLMCAQDASVATRVADTFGVPIKVTPITVDNIVSALKSRSDADTL